MRRTLLAAMWIGTASVVLAAATARAELHLAWNACHGEPGVDSTATFDCDARSDSLYRLVGTLASPTPMRRVIAVDAVLDFTFQDQTNVPPFWHFEDLGCDNGGLALDDGRPRAGCAAVSNALCGPGGGACLAIITAYGAGYGGPNRARLLFTLARSADSPVDLAPLPMRHFAFQLLFATAFADTSVCAGCRVPVSVVWTQATVYGMDEKGQESLTAARLTCDDPSSTTVVTINGASPAPCAPAPAPEPR